MKIRTEQEMKLIKIQFEQDIYEEEEAWRLRFDQNIGDKEIEDECIEALNRLKMQRRYYGL